MANIIKIKRGLSSDINSAVLELGELAITTDTNKLYVGSVSGVPQEVITISQEQVQAMIDQAIEDETTGLLHLQPTSWINQDIASNGKILSTNDNYQHLHDKTELWYRGEPQPYILDLDFTKYTVEDYVNAGIVELTYSTTEGITYDEQGMHCSDTSLRNGLKLVNPIPVMQNWTIEMTMTMMPFESSDTSLTTVEYNNVMWFSAETYEGHTHNSNCYSPAVFMNGATTASTRLSQGNGADIPVQNVYQADGVEHVYKITWDAESQTVVYYRDGIKIGQNIWTTTAYLPSGEFGYVLGAHKGYSSAKNFATQKGHIIKSILVYETGKKYNMSQATMCNPVDRDVTITGAAGYTYKILGYKDNELHYESEIVEDITPITYSISDLGDGTCDGMNVWFYGDATQDLEVENIIQDIKVDYVEWYQDTTATLMAKQKTPMRVKAKSNLEYAIANYDETGAFINKTDWIAGDETDRSYADNHYVNIAVRTKNEEKIFTADMLKDIEVQIIPDDYATVEYVDNAIANIDIPEVDFTGYATEDYVNTQIEAIPDVDLSSYVTQDEIDDVVANALGSTVTWYYTPSVLVGTTIDGVTYDAPAASASNYGYAIANTTGLSKIRNVPINTIRWRLSPDETKTSGTMNFAVVPINSSTYTKLITVTFSSDDIQNGWVTSKLDSSFTIGDNETLVIQPVSSEVVASSVGIAVLRASVATTTQEYINIYHTVPTTWGNNGNYITRLGLCVDLGYTTSVDVATKEYVDSTFGKIHIGTEAPTDESVYCWVDTTKDNLINFSMTYYGSRAMQAMKDMTWGEWVNSDFNRTAFYEYENSVYYIGGHTGYYITFDDVDVQLSDIIIPNAEYTFRTVGYGGGGSN